MSGLSAWIWGTSQLDDAIDRATSELLPTGSEDIALNLEICDQIRSKSAPARDAMRAIKRRLNHKNPNVQLLALGLSDICVKNGGDLFLVEIASREFMDNLVSIVKLPALNQDVKNTILRLIQSWSIAFEGKQNLSYAGTVYESLKKEGFKFPPKDMAVANSAMIDTQTAPEWVDSDLCLRCRTPFTFTNRKHHCRNCGQVFDQACSSKSMPLPHYGITQEVRVCDGCYNKMTKKAAANAAVSSKKDQQQQHRKHHHSHSHSHRTATQDLEDAELQRAIELSLEASRSPAGAGYASEPERWQASEPPIIDRRTRPVQQQEDPEDDPDLRAAIEASLREASAPRPSAPMAEPSAGYHEPTAMGTTALPPPPVIPHYDLDPLETDTILTFNQTVEQVEASGGRDLSRYPAVTELYDKASGLRPKLAMSLDDTGKKQEVLSDMHSKLSEAVKLYDQILTHQVSQPRWRSAVASPSGAPTYQPAVNAYHSGYSPQQQQWNVQQQQQQVYSAPPPPVEQYATPSSPPQQSQWAQQQQAQYASAPSAPQMSPTVQQQVPSYLQQQPMANGNMSTLPPVTFGHPVAVPQSPPPPPPLQQVVSPPPSIEHQQQVGLGRSNSVATSYGAQQSTTGLTRSSTTAGHGYQHQQPQRQYTQPHQQLHQQQQHQVQYQQQQYAQDQYRQSLIANAPAPPTSVLSLPSVPSEAPFVPKEERKEALLIDL